MEITPLHWLLGKPSATGLIKQSTSDFRVIEDLGYTADHQGEHLLIRIRKTGCNTRFVADALAKFLKIPAREVSYAGMKDRHAVTEQTFCARLPGKEMPSFAAFELEGVEILEVARHQRKVRIGGLAGNYFQLVIRDISDAQSVEQRLALISTQGVPNYFGEQRFGRDRHNLTLAEQWAAGEIRIKDRAKRSLLLSAIRSDIFNQVTSARIAEQSTLTTLWVGDCVQLTGRGSWFIVSDDEYDETVTRVRNGELRITAPLVGKGNPVVTGSAAEFEQQHIVSQQPFIDLLIREKVDAARRAMLVCPQEMAWTWIDEHTLQMNFWLPAGSFATSVVRELVLQGEMIEDPAE
ncbi:tRNA pseudouridine(13) synthase TruD [Rosenbergiella australiborealis]|uniref:tRNA pseudouridine synthase D n=1 Tax=Rosenbergiella australiborealis TaxID=1544696 RepID=A0ABS5T6K4_9GAMM|nr:tRNA pseudouridine(13) synthase TruD [Rosenbergiella australiborealis]MBT0727985.1 tRNA pseudouridine(13) synthase TruD [Rosenbergiella australiborealis]